MIRQHATLKSLQWTIIGFFVLVSLSLVVIYLIEPSIYTSTLSGGPTVSDRYPATTTLFFLAILVFIAVLVYGVIHHWRWLFWLLLVAFSFSVLDIPTTLLQLTGLAPMIPNSYPLWYSLYRMGVACLEVIIAIWMWSLYRHSGVWGLGKKRSKTH